MPITNVQLSNTFDQFRQTFNDAANTINSLTSGFSNSPVTANSFTANNLTSGRIAIVGANGLIQDDSGLTYNPTTDILTVIGGVTATNLTPGRIVIVGTSGFIQDDSGLTYNPTTDVLTSSGAIVSPNVTSTSLTSGRVALVGTSGTIQDDAGLTYNSTTDVLTVAGAIVSPNVTATNLTSGRVAIVGTSGIIQDDSGLTYNPTTDVLTLSGTTDSTSSGTGTLVVSGGVGVAKNLYVSGNTFITGNLTVLGSNSELSTTQINVNDSLIQLANNNTSDLVDIGVFGQYNSGAANLHSGLFRDSIDGVWKLFKSYNQEPTTKISTSANNFAYADLNVGILTTNSSITVSSGGTGANTFAANNVLLGNGTSALQVVAPGASGNVLTSDGTTWSSKSPSTGGTTASGSVTLTSASAGAQSITTTNYGQSVTLPNATTVTKGVVIFNIRNTGSYPLKIKDNSDNVYGFLYPQADAIVGLADNSTAAGVWTISNLEPIAPVVSRTLPSNLSLGGTPVSQPVILDSTRTLYVVGGTTASAVYAVVYDASTGTFGSVATVVASGTVPTAVAISSSSVLVVYAVTTTLTSVILSIAGTTITVNGTTYTAAASTITSYGASQVGYSPWVVCGSTYILRYLSGTQVTFRAFTVSGTAVTIGTAVAPTGATGTNFTTFPINTGGYSSFLAFYSNATSTIYIQLYTVSGVTITTAGSLGGATLPSDSPYTYRVIPHGSVAGRFWITYVTTAVLATVLYGVSGITEVLLGAVQPLTAFSYSAIDHVPITDLAVCGAKLVVASNIGNVVGYNIVTDNSGSISAGTAIVQSTLTLTTQPIRVVNNSTTATFAFATGTAVYASTIDASGSSPVQISLRSTGYVNSSFAPPVVRIFDSQVSNTNSVQQFSTNSAYYTVPSIAVIRSITFTNGGYHFPMFSYSAIVLGVSGLTSNRISSNNFYTIVTATTPNMLTLIECATV
jgi:hypothetical protein